MNQSEPERPTILPPDADLPRSSLAIASLVTGILGFMGPVLFSIAALWTGYAARKETRSQPPRASGDGMATAGIVMGYIQLALVGVGALCLTAYAVYFLYVIGLQGH